MISLLFQIKLSYATAGIVTINDVVVCTAPIFKWMMGKTLIEVTTWVKNKNGKLTLIK